MASTMNRSEAVTESAQTLLETIHSFKQRGWFHRIQLADDLSQVESMVLRIISHHGTDSGIAAGSLGAHLRISSPTVTQHITSLEHKGYVKRKIDRQDRRIIRVSLTGKGKEREEQIRRKFLEVFEGLVTHLGEERSRELIDLLNESSRYFCSFSAAASHGTRTADSEPHHTRNESDGGSPCSNL